MVMVDLQSDLTYTNNEQLSMIQSMCLRVYCVEIFFTDIKVSSQDKHYKYCHFPIVSESYPKKYY